MRKKLHIVVVRACYGNLGRVSLTIPRISSVLISMPALLPVPAVNVSQS